MGRERDLCIVRMTEMGELTDAEGVEEEMVYTGDERVRYGHRNPHYFFRIFVSCIIELTDVVDEVSAEGRRCVHHAQKGEENGRQRGRGFRGNNAGLSGCRGCDVVD